MQKKIIALAVAGLVSGAAFAQSNVTIYGVADAYYGHLSATGNQSVNAINSGGLSGSRLGFRGNEDLGGGLKAVFEYELAFNLDNTGTSNAAINSTGAGNGITGTRQSYVGLSSATMGTVVLGRLQTPGYYIGKFDALASSTISPQAILSGNLGATINPGNNGRVNNAAAYISPTFGGFSAVAAYGFGEENVQSAEEESVFGLGLNYAAGPFAISYVHHSIDNVGANNTAAGVAPDRRENMIGASYDLGMVKILGNWQDVKTGNNDDSMWQLGAVAPIGKGNLHFAYGKTSRDVNSSDAKSWTLAYTYGLSKRTTLYTGYNRTTNDRLQTAGILAPTAGGSSKALVAGLRHTF